MIKVRNLNDIQLSVPIYTAADIQNNALVMPGVTAETDLGTLILSDTTSLNALGMMTGLFDYSEKGTSVVAGTTWVKADIKPCFSADVIEAFYDQDDTMVLAGAESSQDITITSLEDNIDTSYLYCTTGTGKGQLRFVDTSASGTCHISEAGDPEWDTSDTCIKILRLFHGLAKPNATMTKLGTDTAAGAMKIFVIDNFIVRSGVAQSLDPTKHEALSGLDAAALNTQFKCHFFKRSVPAFAID